MFKSNLQELCQKSSWSLPKYSVTKQGLDHNPLFSSTVLVNHLSFHTLTLFKSSKEAQNEAARLAFEHLSLATPTPTPAPTPSIPSSSSFPQPSLPLSSGSSVATTGIDIIHSAGETFPNRIDEEHRIPEADYCTSRVNFQVNGITPAVQEYNKFRDVQNLYKNELQTYAQKRNLVLPIYSCEREGPPHASRFKCKVTVDGKTYESEECYSTLKEAEHAAAKVALTALSPEGVENDDSAFYKNLLQQLVHKVGFLLPIYSTNRLGEAHSPVFVSTVEIEGEHFCGEKAKTKKQAEISAAKVAYNSLRERNCKSSKISVISPPSLEEQEGRQLLPSSLQSNISAVLQQDVRPNVPMISSQNETPMQQEENLTGKGGSASTNILNGSTPETSPSAAYCESTTDSNSPSTSNCFNNSAVDSSILETSANKINLSYKKITVYPAGKQIPNGATLLPIRDDNWVAFCSPEAR